jgi:hypothetical protein
MTHSNGTNGTFAKSLTVLTEQIRRLMEVVTIGFADMKNGMSELKDSGECRGDNRKLKCVGCIN